MCSHISTYKVVGTIIESWCLGKSQIFTIPHPFDENNLFSNQSLGQFHIFPIQRNPDTWKYKEELAKTLMALTVDQILKRIGSYGWYQKRLTLIIGLMEGVNMVYQILIIVFIAAEPNWRCVTNATNCTLEGSFRPGHANYHLRCKIARDQWEFEKRVYVGCNRGKSSALLCLWLLFFLINFYSPSFSCHSLLSLFLFESLFLFLFLLLSFSCPCHCFFSNFCLYLCLCFHLKSLSLSLFLFKFLFLFLSSFWLFLCFLFLSLPITDFVYNFIFLGMCLVWSLKIYFFILNLIRRFLCLAFQSAFYCLCSYIYVLNVIYLLSSLRFGLIYNLVF